MKTRGWVIDEILAIGHLEAALTHIDEKASENEELCAMARMIYENRRDRMANLFRQKDIEDPSYWCLLKHLATAYVLSEEICHTKEYGDTEKDLMEQTGDALAWAISLALGIEPTECLRCLSEMGEEMEEK